MHQAVGSLAGVCMKGVGGGLQRASSTAMPASTTLSSCMHRARARTAFCSDQMRLPEQSQSRLGTETLALGTATYPYKCIYLQ